MERFRQHKDAFFREDHHSPLLPDQQERFERLDYFPENPGLHFEVELDREAVSHDPVELDTTTGERQVHVPAGVLHLTIEGQQVDLVLYRQPERGRYFLPFRDGTSGAESYELGRYLDPQEKPDDTLIVDFNYAYNPYCAYNDMWTCPIPPAENRVDVPIRAGEKKFPLAEPQES